MKPSQDSSSICSTCHSETAYLTRWVRVGVARLALGAGDDRLVGGAESDSGLLQLVFDLRADVGATGDPLDRLTDHGGEAAVGTLGLFEESGHAAVTRDTRSGTGTRPRRAAVTTTRRNGCGHRIPPMSPSSPRNCSTPSPSWGVNVRGHERRPAPTSTRLPGARTFCGRTPPVQSVTAICSARPATSSYYACQIDRDEHPNKPWFRRPPQELVDP
jgi:hypothetical protein